MRLVSFYENGALSCFVIGSADRHRLCSGAWVTVSPQFISDRLQVGDISELEQMPNGKIEERILRDRKKSNLDTA
jgi:hypothetical protein